MKNRIKQLRDDNKLSQQQLADLAGVSQTCISAYEKDEYDPSVLTLVSLSDILDTSIDYLLRRSEVQKPLPEDSLSLDENRMLAMYRKMGSSSKERLKAYAEGLLDK